LSLSKGNALARPYFVQNLAVYLLVLIGVESAKLAKSCSQFPGHLSRSALGARGFRPPLDNVIFSLPLPGSSDLITPEPTGSGDQFSPSYGLFCNSSLR
jgi:hypothetical protein